MQTRLIEWGDIRLTISEATVLIGMRRTRIRLEMEKADEPDLDRKLLGLYTYPDLVAATIQAEGLPWPPEFEAFLELPDALVAQWENAVYELNPHWLPGGNQPAGDDAEKKVQTNSTAA
jgi:hypothetical protein